MDPKRKNRKIEAQASALCSRALSEAHAVIDVMDLGKLQRCAVDALQSGRTQDGARHAVDAWIAANRRDNDAHRAAVRRTTHNDEHGRREVETCNCGASRTIETSPDHRRVGDDGATISEWSHPASVREG